MSCARCNEGGVHKWLVLASAFVTFVIQDGFGLAFGALFVAIVDEYDVTRAEAAIVQATLTGFYMGSGVVSGCLVKRFGPLKTGLAASGLGTLGILLSYFSKSVPYLIVSIGVVNGFGTSLLFISASTITESYFDGKVKLAALSMLATGSGVGGLAYPYLLPYLNNLYGLNWTFLIIGALCSNGICCSLLWSSREKHGLFSKITISNYEITNTTSVEDNEIADSDDKAVSGTAFESFKFIIKNKAFMFFTTAMAISTPTFTIFLIFIVDIFDDKGYTESDSSLGLVIWNIFNIIGRLSPGYIMQIQKFPDMGILIVSSFLCAFAILGIGMFSNLILSFLSCAVVGLHFGVIVVMFSLGSLRLLGRKHIPTAMGLLFTLCGITCSGAGPVCGLARDRTDSYAIPLYSGAGCLMLSCLLFIGVHVIQRRGNKRHYVLPETE